MQLSQPAKFLLAAVLSVSGVRWLHAGTPFTPEGVAVISIRTANGSVVTFTPAGVARTEVVNERLNLAIMSREGMIFELTGIPAHAGIAARRYRGAEYRALLLHSPYQQEAASDDPFDSGSTLEIRKSVGKDASGGDVAGIHYQGQLRAGAETLDVQLRISVLLPTTGKSVEPQPQAPAR